MKRSISIICSLALALQTLLGAMSANASGDDTGETYTAPESPAVTYNMNLDWKFKEAPNGVTTPFKTAYEAVAKGGKQFYEVGYDDSDWEGVSIPHAVNGEDSFTSNTRDAGGGAGRMGVFLYRKTFMIPENANGKIFFELEGIRQAAYVWVNGQKVGYYEAGITAMGFDITSFVTSGQTALIAIANDATATSGNPNRFMYETVPGEEWGSSYTPDNFKTNVGGGTGHQWNVRSFNEVQAGLVYNAYLHVKGNVYQTLPLYNNLKTTGNYIYADNFDTRENKATIHVDAEVRNESASDGNYSLEVAVTDHTGKLAYSFNSGAVNVPAAKDKDTVFQTAVENDVYDKTNTDNPVGLTKVNTVDVTHIEASINADDIRFWSIDDPYLYTVYTILKDSNGAVVDVQKKDTGFRKVSYDPNQGILINDKAVWLKGYAQRSTNEWAVIGVANDWLTDYDMSLLKENNANFIRWMHVAPKPNEVRSSDRYGIAVVCPAGDKEGESDGRAWSQRTEAMRDAMIYFRNSPSVLFWETGNSPISGKKAAEMQKLRDEIDPKGMRFIGARSTKNAPDQLNYEYNYAGTMYGNYASDALAAMKTNGIYGPIMETEYAREEAPRRVWDDYSPPDFDYVNKALKKTKDKSKEDGYDAHDLTQEDITVSNVREYNGYYANRAGAGNSIYSAEAMMVWSDSNMHGRNTATENCRTSGRVDPVRQTKEMFEGTRVAHSDKPAVHIIGHWSYPKLEGNNYKYFDKYFVELGKDKSGNAWGYYEYDKNKQLTRDPIHKTVYAIGSADVASMKLFRIDGSTETEIGSDDTADSNFIYQFDNIDVTQGDGVIAKAYDARGEEIATDKIERTYEAAEIKLIPHTADEWRADGSDIAYIDVQVVDKNGNVCALNYDKIDFTYEGEGIYLGGYNSGTGAGCFQNNSGSTGLSSYFGGVKDGVSTIRKDYVYAENGTNRIFIKSTRKAGKFKITASMGSTAGVLPKSIEITSAAVETDKNGLTTQMPAILPFGVSTERPSVSTVLPIKPLAKKFTVDWSKAVIEKIIDTNVYYTTTVNGQPLDISSDKLRVRAGVPSDVYGPISVILRQLKEQGADIDYTLETINDRLTLKFAHDGHNYTIRADSNEILTDNQPIGAGTEIVQDPSAVDGELLVSLGTVLGYMGIGIQVDDEALTVNVTYSIN